MSLTDPELDLLRELLEDDPTSELYLQVGEELVRRGVWDEAVVVLQGGLAGEPSNDGYRLLSRASLEVGDFVVCLGALGRLKREPGTEAARIEILALERSGQLDAARTKALAYLDHDPTDVVVSSVVERLDAPPPSMGQRSNDPFLTVARAERYVAIGRIDRAVRTYRRVLFRNPADRGVALRLRQLEGQEGQDFADDLSEELTDPSLVPPEFTMPTPGLSGPADTPPTAEGRHTVRKSLPPMAAPTKGGKRRKRRSLIRR